MALDATIHKPYINTDRNHRVFIYQVGRMVNRKVANAISVSAKLQIILSEF